MSHHDKRSPIVPPPEPPLGTVRADVYIEAQDTLLKGSAVYFVGGEWRAWVARTPHETTGVVLTNLRRGEKGWVRVRGPAEIRSNGGGDLRKPQERKRR